VARKAMHLFSVAFLSLLLIGCWSSREVESLAFVMALGVDTAEEWVQLTVQVALPAGGGGSEGGARGGDAPIWMTSTKAASITEGLAKLPAVFGREPFLGHLQVVVVGEEYAAQGIAELLDFLARERQVRETARLAVAIGKAEELLKVEPKVVQMPADYIFEVLKRGAPSGCIPPSELLRSHMAWHNRPQLQIVLPLIQAKEKEPPEEIILKGSAVFLDDRMVGSLSLVESRGLAWLMGTVADAYVVVPRAEGEVIQHANFASVSYRMKQAEEGSSLVAIVRQDGNLMEWPYKDEGITFPLLKQLEGELAAVIKSEILAGLMAIREYRTDVVGIGEQVRRLAPEQFAALDWTEAFPNFPLEVQVEASFRRVGLILR